MMSVMVVDVGDKMLSLESKAGRFMTAFRHAARSDQPRGDDMPDAAAAYGRAMADLRAAGPSPSDRYVVTVLTGRA